MATCAIDLSGNTNRVDSSSLGIGSSSVSGGGTNLISGAAVDLRTGTFLTAGTQAFTFNFGGTQVTATVGGGATGLSGQALVDQLNTPDQRVRNLGLYRCHHRPTELQRRLHRI